MVLRLIRWLRGYVVFTVSGAFPERFLNLMNTRGVRRWEFLPENGGYSGKMFLSDYLKIRPLARKASVKLCVRERIGLPFFAKKYRHRSGLLVGAVAGLLILGLLSGCIWDIRVVGAERVSEARLRSAFEKSGFHVGMFKSALDVIETERKIELDIPEIRWLSINALNNVATVEIKEKAEKPKLRVQKYPCNIKAAEDGVITDIKVSSGVCEVKRGSAVAANQLLVNSVTATRNGDLNYVHSEAEIYADVKADKQIIIPKSNNVYEVGERYTEKRGLRFLNFILPFGFSPSDRGLKARCYTTELLRPTEVTLPLGVVTERSYYITSEKQKLDRKTAEELLKTRLALYECFDEGESRIKRREYKIGESKNSFVLRSEYLFNRNIAVSQRIRVKNSGQ